MHPVFGIDTERVPPNDAMSRFVGFGDKIWDNLKNYFGTADDFLDRYAALPSAARNSAGVRPPSASLRLSVL